MITSNTLSQIGDWFIPNNIKLVITELILNKKNWQNYHRLGSIIAANKVFHNIHQGKRCFILATGPSIKKQDLKPLKNEFCIALSNFFVHPDFQSIKPQYYCIAPYHLPISEEGYIAWVREIDAFLDEKITFFFGANDYWRIERTGIKKRRSYVPFFRVNSQNAPDSFSPDLTRKVMSPITVVIMGLQIAMYLGFQEIYLLGCDHDYILHYGESSHFYQEKEHSLVRAGYNEWDEASIYSQMKWYIHLWEDYQYLNEIAKKNKIKIYNATEGGLLDVFPWVILTDILSSQSDKL